MESKISEYDESWKQDIVDTDRECVRYACGHGATHTPNEKIIYSNKFCSLCAGCCSNRYR